MRPPSEAFQSPAGILKARLTGAHASIRLSFSQARNDPFMDPDKLPTGEDLEGAPVRLSYYEVNNVSDVLSGKEGFFETELGFKFCSKL